MPYWGVSEGCFRPLGGSPERFYVMYPGGNFVKIPPLEGQIGQGTSTERFLFENQCRRWPRRPCGQLGMIIFSDDVGKTSFPGLGVSEGCFRGVFQRGVSEGCFRPLGLRDRPAQGNFETHTIRSASQKPNVFIGRAVMTTPGVPGRPLPKHVQSGSLGRWRTLNC